MAHYSSLALLFLCLCYTSLTKALNSGFSVELIHRDSPKSPFYRPSETQFQRVANAVSRSMTRANHFNTAFVPKNTPQSPLIPDGYEYLMSFSIGTPPFKLFAIADTGSDIVWFQCKPCKHCINRKTPMFDPSKSRTYKTIPCSSATCKSFSRATCSSNNKQICEYAIEYEDGSRSQGNLSMDSLILGSSNGSLISFPRIVVGCGQDDTNSLPKLASGIVGLGHGPISLTTQLGFSKFSYCLVPYLNTNSSSKLSFGDRAMVSGPGTVSTPLLQNSDNVYYYLTLEALSVGNNRIELGNSSTESSQKGNIVIDSGTTLTLLPDDVYSRLESAVADVVKLKRVKDPTKRLSLCYKVTSEQLKVPTITAHFRSADVQLSALNTFTQVDDEIMCFSFASSNSGSTFGNMAQQNFLIGYDLQKNVLSFKPKDCTKQ